MKVETVCALIVAGLDHMSSFEEIHTELMIMILCDIIFIISHNVYHTTILIKFQINSKLVGCLLLKVACLSELPGTEFKDFVVPINGAAGSAMCKQGDKDLVILIIIFWSNKVVMV